MTENSFDDVLERLQSKDDVAAAKIFDRFANRLIALARTRLNGQLRQKVDPEDVAQSVFRSFFRRQGEGEFTLEDWGGLWGLLVTMTVRKCGRQAEIFHAARRDVRRETNPGPVGDQSGVAWEAPGAEPTPLEAATLAETVEQVMRSLDERGQTVFSLRLQGYSVPEISEQIGRTERTVQRTLNDIRKLLDDLNGQTLNTS